MAVTGSCGYSDREGGGPWRRRGAAATVTGREADLGGEGEGGKPWWRRGAAATVTGREADLGGDGERRLQ